MNSNLYSLPYDFYVKLWDRSGSEAGSGKLIRIRYPKYDKPVTHPRKALLDRFYVTLKSIHYYHQATLG